MDLNLDYRLFNYSVTFLPLLLAGVISSFAITCLSIPTIVRIARYRKLVDIPNHRTSHKTEVPVLGGLAIFAGFSISSILFTSLSDSPNIRFLMGGIIILFLLGLKDDILMLDPKKKILGQIFAAAIVVILGNIRVSDFHNILGITSVGYIPGIIFTIFLLLVFINGFNLIDGVDGLSSGLAILASLMLGAWFCRSGHYNEAIISGCMVGTLSAYFIFNVTGTENKIFMGDTGAMIVGLILSFLSVRFLELERTSAENLRLQSAPAVLFGLFFVPFFDMIRVVVVRISKRTSPFRADKKHIHHLLLRFGLSHLAVSLILIGADLFFLLLLFLLQPLGGFTAIVLSLLLATIMSGILHFFMRKKNLKSDTSE